MSPRLVLPTSARLGLAALLVLAFMPLSSSHAEADRDLPVSSAAAEAASDQPATEQPASTEARETDGEKVEAESAPATERAVEATAETTTERAVEATAEAASERAVEAATEGTAEGAAAGAVAAVAPALRDLSVPGCADGMLCTVCLAGCPGGRNVIVHAQPKPLARD